MRWSDTSARCRPASGGSAGRPCGCRRWWPTSPVPWTRSPPPTSPPGVTPGWPRSAPARCCVSCACCATSCAPRKTTGSGWHTSPRSACGCPATIRLDTSAGAGARSAGCCATWATSPGSRRRRSSRRWPWPSSFPCAPHCAPARCCRCSSQHSTAECSPCPAPRPAAGPNRCP